MSYLSWTAPTRNVHPRVWVTPSTLSTYQTRIEGSHSGYWSSLQSWVSSRLSYSSSYWASTEAVYLAALAFSYLLKPSSNLAHGQKARDVALYIANLSIPSGFQKRQYVMEMALVYDWCWAMLTDTERSTLRNRIATYCGQMYYPNDAEFLWGTSHGYICFAAASLPAILEDGTNDENTTRTGWMNTMMDAFYNGTNSDCYWAGFRHFGDTDGGTHKGCGPFSYLHSTQDFYSHVLPSLATALQAGVYSSEAWWSNLGHWLLWHWRGDHTHHRQAELRATAQYSISCQVHSWIVADLENNDFGRAMQWHASEIESTAQYCTWGPYHVFSILHHNTGRIVQKPTIANQAQDQMYVFESAGKACFRDGWDETSTSFVLSFPRAFVGGHSQRDAGAFWLARSKPLFVSHGHYDASQNDTYKVPGDSLKTGHRYTYYAQGLAFSGIRIYDSDEPSENAMNSHQRFTGSSSRFGVWNGSSVDISNQGGMLWPKNTGNTVYQPYDLASMLADSKWYPLSTKRAATKATKYCYLCADIAPWYYSSKVTKVRRHVLWIKTGQIPGWNYPIIMLFDDLVTHVDSVKGKLTQVLQFQSQVAPTGTAASWQVDRSPDRCLVRILTPSVEWTTVADFKDVAGVEYPETSGSPATYDDSNVGVHRVEINPASSGTDQQFLTLLFPVPNTVSSPPSLTLISDGSWIGATIGGVDCKIAKGDTHSATVGDSPDTTPPAAPTWGTATAKNQAAELDWNDNAEGDFDHYEVWRRNRI